MNADKRGDICDPTSTTVLIATASTIISTVAATAASLTSLTTAAPAASAPVATVTSLNASDNAPPATVGWHVLYFKF